MITCIYCGDTTGPFVYIREGFVCENCEEKVNIQPEDYKTLYKKGEIKNDIHNVQYTRYNDRI